ncbi:MAG TPA: hypothetical protein VM386_04850 [Acidimicrobiales bacterium]|nr:hypothetical protein [Acidimicrobiales bacterium]
MGLATGMGMAGAHALYSAIAMTGLQSVSTMLGTHSDVVRVVSATIMVGLRIRIAFGGCS